MANYAFDATLLPQEAAVAMLAAEKHGVQTVNALLAAVGQATPVEIRVLMWLWKFDLVQVRAA